MKSLLKVKNTAVLAAKSGSASNTSNMAELSRFCFPMSTPSASTSEEFINNNNSQQQGLQTLLPGAVPDGEAGLMRRLPKRIKSLNQDDGLKALYKKLLKHHRGLLVLGTIGALLVGLASLVYVLDPLEIITKAMLSFTEGSYLFRMWRRPPPDVYVRFYIFNVTNHEAFIAGTEKLKLQEIGPITYKEVLINDNVTFNSNGTVTYIPQRQVFFVPELTTGVTMETRVIVPNIPLIGFVSMLADSSMLSNLALLTLTNYLDIQPFLNLSIQEFLWGYDDPVIKLASTIAPSWIGFERLGLMDRMFDDGINVVTMSLSNQMRVNEDGRVLNPLTIDQYNGSPGMKHWGYDEADSSTQLECNTLQGLATEGVFFQRHLTPRDTFVIYRKAFCRTLRIVFDHAGFTENNVPAYWYRLPDDVFDNTNPANSCYCKKGKRPCLPRGLSDVTPCYYGIPAAVSLPHFLNSDPSLLEAVEGLSPDKEKHATVVIMQPEIGIPMIVHSRIQTNIVVRPNSYHKRVAPFFNLTVPIFWADLSMDGLPPSLDGFVLLVINIAPTLQAVITAALALSGLAMIAYSICRYTACVRLPVIRKTTDRRPSVNYALHRAEYITEYCLEPLQGTT